MRTFIVIAAIVLAVSACFDKSTAGKLSPATSAAYRHASTYLCPEPDPAQPNCKVKP